MWLLQFWQQYCGKGDWEEDHAFPFSFPPPSKPIADQLEIPSGFFLRYIGDRIRALWVIPAGEPIPSQWESNEAVGCTGHGRHSCERPDSAACFRAEIRAEPQNLKTNNEFCHPLKVFGSLLLPFSEAMGFQVQSFAIKLLAFHKSGSLSSV